MDETTSSTPGPPDDPTCAAPSIAEPRRKNRYDFRDWPKDKLRILAAYAGRLGGRKGGQRSGAKKRQRWSGRLRTRAKVKPFRAAPMHRTASEKIDPRTDALLALLAEER